MAACSECGGRGNGQLAYFSPFTFSIVEEIALTRKNPANAWVFVNKKMYFGSAIGAGTNRTKYPA